MGQPQNTINLFLIFAHMQLILKCGRMLFSNFYFGTSALFLVWITFFDGNDLIGLFGNHMKLRETESEILFYQKKIDAVAAENTHLIGSAAAKEKFAREKFLMRKENEDVFLVEKVNTSLFDKLTGN
jgi:cell division protein DivIC